MSPLAIIDKYYPQDNALRRLLLHHSWQVADFALRCEARHRELRMDRELILYGALLHDVGIFLTNAPKIHCHGKEHYLMHGFLGARLMREMGLESIARICERHTGAGLTKEAVLPVGMPVLSQDYLPQTLEEELVCYADKFYSKSRAQKTLSYDEALTALMRFGEDGVMRFQRWHKMFGIN